ncbi:cytochrome c [Labrenzia sp. PHM005]|uniref:c-type cytochrome n=1 Tax=Labrenzia sp. PHM005 TaxID=2590016 RepID=UPI00114086A4|nr:cytochrome c [Labrenzia sp. PHM005]QDG75244.1 cytochrome c [Labrenzia sp. PHM005]
MGDFSGIWRKKLSALALLLGVATVLTPGDALSADTVAGKALALQWCASCHLVSNDQSSASSVSLPSFFDMSKDPSWTAEKLATFLANPHPQMPDMTLGNIEITNLAAYIQSLNSN